MPTHRFHNLPAEKRDRITSAAMAEFVANGIDAAQVAGVVKRAGIPRGSFYQYFTGLDDLFGHVMGHVVKAKTAYLGDLLGLAGTIPFVDYLERTFRAGLRFALDYPDGTAFARRVNSSASPAVIEYVRQAERIAMEHYRPLVELDKAKGLIRPSVDSGDLVQFVLAVFSDVVAAALLGQTAGQRDPTAIADTMFDVLRHGIQANEGGQADV